MQYLYNNQLVTALIFKKRLGVQNFTKYFWPGRTIQPLKRHPSATTIQHNQERTNKVERKKKELRRKNKRMNKKGVIATQTDT